MNKGVWIAILLSIPINLLTGLLVAPIKSWYKGWGQTREISREKRLRSDYVETLYYVQHPHKFNSYLLLLITQMINHVVIFIVGYFFMLSGVLIAILQQMPDTSGLGNSDKHMQHACLMMGIALTSLASALWSNTFVDFYSTWKRVNNSDSYLSSVPDNIRNLTLEHGQEGRSD